MSIIILNCQFCKIWFTGTSNYGFVADYENMMYRMKYKAEYGISAIHNDETCIL